MQFKSSGNHWTWFCVCVYGKRGFCLGVCVCSVVGSYVDEFVYASSITWQDHKVKIFLDWDYVDKEQNSWWPLWCKKTVSSICMLSKAVNSKNDSIRKRISCTVRPANAFSVCLPRRRRQDTLTFRREHVLGTSPINVNENCVYKALLSRTQGIFNPQWQSFEPFFPS